MKKFCDIRTRDELANFLSIPRSKLTYMLYKKKPDAYYTTFKIPKKSGGVRTICAPSGDLKELQEKLADMLWLYQKSLWEEQKVKPNLSHAFEKGKSIITNARIHHNKRYVLNLDLENFFDSFHFGRVQGFFEKNRNFELPHEVAVVIAQLTCCQGRLPQGAPSSPIITNLLCQILDFHLLKLAKKYKLDYTRYADDLTFSTNHRQFIELQADFLEEAEAVIGRAGFSIQKKKTRLLFRDSRQEVTGLIVNKKISVNHAYVRKTRAMAHQLYTKGEFLIDGVPGTVNQLEGRFSFIDQLDHYNNSLDSLPHDAYHLCGRERQYRAFLFYKYFFANEKPLIVTEGKTDIRYLKAALKNLYTKYPRLIEKDKDGRFIFKVSFLRRTKRWKYFFGVSLDGADAMKILYRYFVGKNSVPNYLSDFRKLSGHGQKNPVIFLYDNESVSDRPLRKFLNGEIHAASQQKDDLKNHLYIQLLSESKLFLATNPLPSGMDECEIEGLFPPQLLALTLDGKTFTPKDKYDTKKHFGKDIFSQYVYANYRKIDFSQFIPLLDVIDLIVARQAT